MPSTPRGNGGGPGGSGIPGDPFARFEDDFEGDATRVEQEATSHDQPSAHAPQLHPTLTCEAGPDLGKRFNLIVGETGIGRSIDNDVILTDIAVSRKHIKLMRDDAGNVTFQDLGSGNGTLVNGAKVRNGVLRSGDRIEIGETRFVLSIPTDAEIRGARERTDTARAGYDHDPTAPPQLGQAAAAMPMLGASAGQSQRPAFNAQVAAASTVRPPSMPGGPPPMVGMSAPPPPMMPMQGYAAQPPQGFQHGYVQTPLNPMGVLSTQALPAVSGKPVKHAPPIVGKIIGAIVLLGAGIGIGMLLLNKPTQGVVAPPAQRPDASAFVAAGTAAYNARHFTEAEAAFRQALTIVPNEPRAAQYILLINEARAHETKLATARAAFAQGNAEATLAALVDLPESSLFRNDINVLRVSARDQIVARLLSEARAARHAGHSAEARDRLARAAGYDPTNAEVIELGRLIAPNGFTPIPPPAYVPQPVAAAEETPRESGSSSSSNSGGGSRSGSRSGSASGGSNSAGTTATANSGGLRTPMLGADAFERPSARTNTGGARVTGVTADIHVLELYRNGDFSGAARYARTAAGNATGGTAHRLADMASSIDRFSREYQRVRAAGDDTLRVARSIESAIALDQDISGGSAYAAQLRPLLVTATVAAAVSAWNAGQFTESCQKIRRASELDSRNTTVRDYVRRCEQRASTVLQDAVASERSNVTQAQELYRAVLTLVPASSPSYRTAAARLSALGHARPVDEDE